MFSNSVSLLITNSNKFSGTGDQNKVIMLQPFTAKDFAIRSLADRLNDLNHLLYLYPDIPKENAFGRHYTPISGMRNIYIYFY